LLGQVVFLDMAFLKIRSLVASDCPPLTGEFMLSPSMLLRALHEWEIVTLEHDQGNELDREKSEIIRCIAPVFSTPFFRSKQASLETQVAYHTRFSVDLLFKERLLNQNGYTRGLANFASHLFDIEPANFILARLLGKGLLHKYLEREQKRMIKGQRRTHLTVKLTSILAWFLCRKRLPNIVPKDRVPRKKHLPSADSPALPALPPAIAEEVVAYNESVFEHVQELAWTVASTEKIGKDPQQGDMEMPLSGKTFRSGWDPRGEPFDKEKSEFAPKLIKQITRYRSRSPFTAITGDGDEFTCPADLVSSARNLLHLDMNTFPTVAVPMLEAPAGSFEPSNSWMVDFMIHGKIKYLWDDNGIDPTKAYFLINKFKEAVKKASTALGYFAPEDDIVRKTFKLLHDEIDKLMKVKDGTA